MDKQPDRPVVIELTAKRWKLLQAVGLLLLGVAVVLGMGLYSHALSQANAGRHISSWRLYPVAGFAVIGLGLFAAGRIGAWWNHG